MHVHVFHLYVLTHLLHINNAPEFLMKWAVLEEDNVEE